jgi:GntR family transcriptional regulator, transcriptional repressor for pyruvate dehydrogenase complex
MAEFEPVQPYRMANEIVRSVSSMILDGKIAPGTQLPAERELADRFNVSRPTLREAVHVLEALGLVDVRPGGGTFVSKEPSALPPRLLEHMLRRDEGLVFELIETRREFESRNAALAAEIATANDLQHLEECLTAMEADVDTGRDELRHDIAFHLGVAGATQNRVRLFITTAMLLAHSEILRDTRDRMVQHHRGVVRDFLGEHRAIYLAIKGKQLDQACDAMCAHLDGAYQRNRISPSKETTSK